MRYSLLEACPSVRDGLFGNHGVGVEMRTFFGNRGTEDAPARRRGTMPSRRLVELSCVLAAALAGAAVAWPVLHFHERSLPPDLASYFGMFNPSAMMGTGHGFVSGSEEELPALKAFLHGESLRLDLPQTVPPAFTGRCSDPFVMSHYYLVLALGGWWRLTGVSLHSLMLFAALLYAATAAVLYGVFRLGCGRLTALAGVLCVVASPLWLDQAASVRDFAKATFVLAFLLLAGWAVVRRFSGRGLLAWALATGTVLGFGWGFRQDLLACFLPALLLPWVVQVAGQGVWRWRAGSCLLLFAAIAVMGAPVISAMRDNNGVVSVHTMMQGFSEESESAMHFGDAAYVQQRDWYDASAHAVAAAYAARQGDIAPMGGFHSTSYVAAARRYIAETLRTFPADFYRRGLASACSIPDQAAEVCLGDITPSQGRSPWISRWARVHRPLAEHLGTFGPLYVLLALAVGFAVNFRAAALLAVLGVYIGAYPSLLFQTRHLFHLSFMPYWAVLWLLATAGRAAARRMRAGSGGNGLPWRPMARAVTGMAAFLALLAVTGWCLDRVQARSVGRLLECYRAATLEPVPFREVPRGDGWVLLEPLKPVPGLGPDAAVDPYACGQALLALKLEWGPPAFPVRMVYEGGSAADFSRDIYPLVKNPSGDTPLTCFLPALELNWPGATMADPEGGNTAGRGRFVGIAVPEPQRDRVRGLFRVTDAAQFPLHLFITVPDDAARFVAGKTGPWTRQWALWGAQWGGTPKEKAACLCGVAQRYPYDRRVRHALEALVRSEQDSLVWNQAWPVLASLNPDMPEAEICSRAAKERLAAGDIVGALVLFRRARSLSPNDLRNRVDLGGALEAAGEDDGALEEYRAVLSKAPESPHCSGRIDALYDRRNDPAGRVAEWRRLVQLHPDAAVPRLHLGGALEAAGDLAGAREAYGRALATSPNLAGARAALERVGGAMTGKATR